ncbi:MAG: YIP1 family protein [Chloroflexi bacterium]|nr:YIP1 family protein [Chloroflexota bacterium]
MIDRMLGAARLSADTYEDVERDTGATGQALLIVVLVTLASFVGQMLAGEEIDVVRGLVLGVIRGVVSWAMWALFTWLIGATILKTENTEADWGQLARGTGFAQTPGLLNVITFLPGIGLVIALLTFVWTIAGMVVAVRQCLDYSSTLRAFFVILLAFIPVLILNAIIFTLTGGS